MLRPTMILRLIVISLSVSISIHAQDGIASRQASAWLEASRAKPTPQLTSDFRKIAEGDPSIFWRIADQTNLEFSEDGGLTFRPITKLPEEPVLLTTRAERPRNVFVHFQVASLLEVDDFGAVTFHGAEESEALPADRTDTQAREGKYGRAAAAVACSYSLSTKFIDVGVSSGTSKLSITGTCPWTVVTEDRAFARFYNAETGSPILLPNKNLKTPTSVRVEYTANNSIMARGTVLLVLNAQGAVVAWATVLQRGYNAGRSTNAVENPTATVRLSAKAQPFEVVFRSYCTTCEYPRKPTPWISRIGDVPRGQAGRPITLGFQSQANAGAPRATVIVMYEYVSTPWSGFTTVIQDGK